RFLDAGLRVPLVGGSGKDSNTVALGRVRTYARLAEGQELSYGNWIEAGRAGRTFVTNAPLLQFSAGRPGPGAVLKVAPGQRVPLRAEATSNVRFGQLELLVNGDVVASAAPPAEALSASVEAEWPAERSAWVAARCRGDENLPDGQ